jgi:hypothetical protein
MTNQLVMAIGLDYAVNDKEQGREHLSVEAALHAFRPSLALSEIEKNKATLTFHSYDDAEELIKATYKSCSDTNAPLTE